MDQIKIDIADNSDLAGPLADTRLLKRTVAHVLTHFQINQAAVSVAIVDDEAMKSINKQYLKKTESTDVISFDLSSETDDQSDTQLDCEVVINVERAMIVALRFGFRTDDGLGLAFHMATHGGALALGLTGYGLEAGCAGDVVLLEGENVFESVVNRPPRKVVVKAGRIVARDGVALV
ncbi:MAG: rRNA maturation RNase YbeY [Planctomycetes bacterium]|nr:rRNA maturation RNase YbeY [Planctomycetota bacterium]